MMTKQEQDERYETDSIFRNLVDMFRAFLNRADELHLAALFGTADHDEHNPADRELNHE